MDRIIKGIFFDQVVKAVISKAVIAIPFFGWPVINQIFTQAVHKLAKIFYEEIKVHSIFLQIEFKVESQKREYNHATNSLAFALSDGSKTKKEIEEAKNEYKKKLHDLIMFNIN